MSEKCRKIIYALVVTVFAAFLWMICCENDRKVSDKAIGETTVQSMVENPFQISYNSIGARKRIQFRG